MFDKEKGQTYKSDNHLQLYETIHMARYRSPYRKFYDPLRIKYSHLKSQMAALRTARDEFSGNMVCQPHDARSFFADNPRNQLSKHGSKSMIGSANHILEEAYCTNKLVDFSGGGSVVPHGLSKEMENCELEMKAKLHGERSPVWNNL